MSEIPENPFRQPRMTVRAVEDECANLCGVCGCPAELKTVYTIDLKAIQLRPSKVCDFCGAAHPVDAAACPPARPSRRRDGG